MSRSPASPARWLRLALLVVLATGLLPAAAIAQKEPVQTGASSVGATTLTGAVEMDENQIVRFTEPMAMLLDLSYLLSSATRLDLASQVFGGIAIDGTELSFTLSLPARPLGEPIDVIGTTDGALPQVYAISIVQNGSGTPFLEEEDLWGGPPLLYNSFDFDDDDRLFGQFAVWSAGEGELFPSAVGDDGEPLTPDDEFRELEPGWTIVNIGGDEYDFVRDDTVEVALPDEGVNPTDLTEETFTDAFDALVDQLEAEYPFTDLKGIDFDALREEFRPMVEEAEETDDVDLFNLAIYQFSLAFGDGHVGATRPVEWSEEEYGGSFGLTLARADDGLVYVVTVADGGSAAAVGILPGDAVVSWGDEPIDDAAAAVTPLTSVSSEHVLDEKQLRAIVRAEVGATVSVVVERDGEELDAVELEAMEDLDTLRDAARPEDWVSPVLQPITTDLLPDNVGYIRITTFSTDWVLFTHAWDHAMREFADAGVEELVIDVRANGGGLLGLALYAAASFVDDPVTFADMEVTDGEGGFEPAYELVFPPAEDLRWDNPVSVIVDGDCASSCEMFSAVLSRIGRDDISVVGNTPSAGVFAAIAQWELPGDVYFQASRVRAILDGEIYLEEVGVIPDVDVPVTVESLLSPEDELLDAAIAVARGEPVKEEEAEPATGTPAAGTPAA